ENEAGLREVISRLHDGIPDNPGFDPTVNAAGNAAFGVGYIFIADRKLAKHEQVAVVQIQAIGFDLVLGHGEGQFPIGVLLDSIDEVFGDQQRQVELTQTTVLPLGADEVQHVGTVHIKGSHLSATATTGG